MTNENSSTRKWIFRIAALLIVIIVAIIMFIIGRGHTIYFDNVAIDYEGKTLATPYKVEGNVKGEKVAKLYEKERGMTTTMGQNFSMDFTITEEKGGSEENVTIDLKLPYNIDGIILNVPALLAGAPEDVYLSEFIPTATEEEADEEVIIDEFEMPMESESSESEEG